MAFEIITDKSATTEDMKLDSTKPEEEKAIVQKREREKPNNDNQNDAALKRHKVGNKEVVVSPVVEEVMVRPVVEEVVRLVVRPKCPHDIYPDIIFASDPDDVDDDDEEEESSEYQTTIVEEYEEEEEEESSALLFCGCSCKGSSKACKAI